MDMDDDEERMDTLSEGSEVEDGLGPIPLAALEKKQQPGLFVSAWDEAPDDGVAVKDLNDPGEQFLTAAENGDLQQLKTLYDREPGLLNVRDSDEYTALHRAAYGDHVECVEWLLMAGADLNWRTEAGWTPLHCAACWGCARVVALLLSRGSAVNARTNGEVTPLHLAMASSEPAESVLKTVQCLLQAPGIDLQAISGAGDTPCDIARRNSPQLIQLVEQYR